ncbi:MAG: hypothetical protein KJ971_03800 [Firmicutes bacterium]|nr:hypothetical protein [Bacillota bacterium]
MIHTLKKIAMILNAECVTWGLGGSTLLYHYGLVEKPRDLDIIIETKSVKQVERLLLLIGYKMTPLRNDVYSTEVFMEFVVDDVDVDIMAGFSISKGAFTYVYDFNASSVSNYMVIENEDVPLTSLEDWYILYQMMPDRSDKVQLIEKYFLENGIEHLHYLYEALLKPLPMEIKESVLQLIKKAK